MPASGRSLARSRPISTRSRARCDSSACLAPNARASSASRDDVGRPGLGERAGEREQHRTPASETDHVSALTRTTWRQASTTSAFDACNASTSSSSRALLAARDQARRRRARARAGALSTSAISAGMPASRAARSRPGQRRARRLRAQAAHGDARDHQLVRGPRRRRQRRGVEPGQRALGLVETADQQQAPDLEMARMGGVQRGRHACSSVARAASSALVGQPRSRETSAISASATTQRARATASLGAEGARRPFAAAPWRARNRRAAPWRCRAAPAPARRRAGATRFSAPSGSPAASARAAAVISESMRIPPHL